MAKPMELLVVIAGISMSTAVQKELTEAVGAAVVGKLAASAKANVVLHQPTVNGNSHVIRVEQLSRVGDAIK